MANVPSPSKQKTVFYSTRISILQFCKTVISSTQNKKLSSNQPAGGPTVGGIAVGGMPVGGIPGILGGPRGILPAGGFPTDGT